ncbi:MAG: NFACT family protein [Candidatus Sericytochromatia bacterium]
MIIDNIVVNALKKEFKQKIIGSRIDRIHQVDNYNFLFELWSKKSKNLIISLHPNTYRACITFNDYKTLKIPAPFCSHLKKLLEGAYILDIEQINFDRILKFKLEGINNVKDKVVFYMILELTGKYSNLIITDENESVLTAFKYINEERNQERQILLEKPYCNITNKNNKLFLDNFNQESFSKLVEKSDLVVKKFLISNFLGFSSHTAELVLEDNLKNKFKTSYGVSTPQKEGIEGSAPVPPKTPEQSSEVFSNKKITELNNLEKDILFKIINNFYQAIKNDDIFIDFIKEKDKLDFFITNEENYIVSEYIESHFYDVSKNSSFASLKNELVNLCDKNLKRVEERLKESYEGIDKSKNYEIYEQYSNLIYSNLYNLKENSKIVKVENYYNNNELIEIELDEELTLIENTQKFLKKYNKLKNTIKALDKIINELNQEKSYFEEILVFLDNLEQQQDLLEIKSELKEQNYLDKDKKLTIKKNKKERPNFLSFKSSEGFDILVGKNNTQNDYLTSKFASENDFWFHTRLIPSSHVIVRTDNGQKELTEKVIEEAGEITAKYSKAKNSSNVCIIYTKIKNVKKVPHSKPGFVIYSKEKAVYVTPRN